MTEISLLTRRMALLLFTVAASLILFPDHGLAQKKKRINLIAADVLDYDPRIVANAQRLIGHVNIEVDNALLWCDSLYSYNNNNVDAFGNVHIVRGDTLNMYADYLNYQATNKLAKARRNVRLIDRQMVLNTDSLDYAMQTDVAYYNYGGTLKDSTNVLISEIGQYFVNDKKAYFRKDVHGTTKDYKIKSDTPIYYTETKKVYIEGPTHIYNDKDTLYSEYGWYDSMNGFAKLNKKPLIWNDKQKVKADSIFYNKEKGEGLALGHARLQDIENSIIVTGNKVEYNDLTKIATASDSAVLIQYSKTDSLFLHADRLKAMPDTSKKVVQVKKVQAKKIAPKVEKDSVALVLPASIDSIGAQQQAPDSLAILTRSELKPVVADTTKQEKKEDNRVVLAWNKVRFFREDFQGKCDSLVYFSKDSTIQLYTDPVLWSDKNQISANYIEIINKDKQSDEIRMMEDAFIIAMEEDSIRFNQIKGKDMVGHVRNNELIKIDVDGNGQSNYYARDKNGIIGLNKAESSNIVIYMSKGKVKKIAFVKSPDGELKPLGQLEDTDKVLPGFKWQADMRPVNKDDIFRDPLTTPPPVVEKKKQEPVQEEKPKEEETPQKLE